MVSAGGSTPVNLQKLAGFGPGSIITVEFDLGPYSVAPQQFGQSGAQKQLNFVETLSYSAGRHQLKFGGDYRRLTPTAVPNNPILFYDFSSTSSVQANMADFVFSKAFNPAYPLYENFSAFAADAWKVSPRLNVSLGLRWEVNPAPGVTQGLNPFTVDMYSPDRNNWGLASKARLSGAPRGTTLPHVWVPLTR